jgi:hypothetical protein
MEVLFSTFCVSCAAWWALFPSYERFCLILFKESSWRGKYLFPLHFFSLLFFFFCEYWRYDGFSMISVLSYLGLGWAQVQLVNEISWHACCFKFPYFDTHAINARILAWTSKHTFREWILFSLSCVVTREA